MTQILSIKSSKPEKTVNVTPSAATKIGELIAAEGDPGLALRMAVRPGGCSGFSYELFFDSQVDDTDVVEEYGEVRVIVRLIAGLQRRRLAHGVAPPAASCPLASGQDARS